MAMKPMFDVPDPIGVRCSDHIGLFYLYVVQIAASFLGSVRPLKVGSGWIAMCALKLEGQTLLRVAGMSNSVMSGSRKGGPNVT